MNAADKKAVEQAKDNNSKAPKGGRSKANAAQAQNQITDKIAQARRKTADAIKAQIIGGGIADALHEISMGDFGEVADGVVAAFDTFIDGIDNGHRSLEAAENDPKYLLASESSSTSSFPCYSINEVEGN